MRLRWYMYYLIKLEKKESGLASRMQKLLVAAIQVRILFQTKRLMDDMNSRIADQMIGFCGTVSAMEAKYLFPISMLTENCFCVSKNLEKRVKSSIVSDECSQGKAGDVENLKRNCRKFKN